MSRPVTAAFAGVALAIGAVVLAGCAAPGPAPGRSAAASTASATAPTTPTASPGTVAPSVPVPVPVPVTTGASTVPAGGVPTDPTRSSGDIETVPPAPASVAPRSTCSSIMIRVIRGSAAPGYEFAALQFVNTGSSRCVLNGYPTVTLRRSGTRVGSVSSPSSSAMSSYPLAPGATAESRLKDFSACQAPLSDEIAVVAPGSTLRATRPAQLRACTLRVYPLGAPE